MEQIELIRHAVRTLAVSLYQQGNKKPGPQRGGRAQQGERRLLVILKQISTRTCHWADADFLDSPDFVSGRVTMLRRKSTLRAEHEQPRC